MAKLLYTNNKNEKKEVARRQELHYRIKRKALTVSLIINGILLCLVAWGLARG
jgi:hypothetical protein